MISASVEWSAYSSYNWANRAGIFIFGSYSGLFKRSIKSILIYENTISYFQSSLSRLEYQNIGVEILRQTVCKYQPSGPAANNHKVVRRGRHIAERCSLLSQPSRSLIIYFNRILAKVFCRLIDGKIAEFKRVLEINNSTN